MITDDKELLEMQEWFKQLRDLSLGGIAIARLLPTNYENGNIKNNH